jgi:hypothetical protein
MSTEAERRPIVGYEELYEVSRDGHVFRVRGGPGARAGRKLKPQLDRHGYLRVALCRNGVRQSHSVHRIVAKAFLSNPNNLPEVNHINGIKTDNREENLEHCDCSYNHLHAYRVLGRVAYRKGKPKPKGAGTPNRPVRGTNVKTGEVVEIESACAAARFVNGSQSNICKACQGKHKTAYGWRWEYI